MRNLINLLLLLGARPIQSLTSEPAGRSNHNDDVSFTFFDRFRATCPADPACIRQFDSSLIITKDPDSEVWAAVFRSSNNKPSVLIRDEFLQAMRSATSTESNFLQLESTSALYGSAGAAGLQESFVKPANVLQLTPVAIARLRPANIDGNGRDEHKAWVLDSLRCALKKENTDPDCDGGSEHNEAISTAIDALVEYYLLTQTSSSENKGQRFEGAIRAKATIFSASLLEDRGFRPVERLEGDMATHISSLDACMERYAARSVSTGAKTPGSRQRALNIVSLLGRMDREMDLRAARDEFAQKQKDEEEGEGYDPWASVKRFF